MQEAKVLLASQGSLVYKVPMVSLVYVVILDSQAVQEHQVDLESRANKVIQVWLDCPVHLDHLLRQREGLLDLQEAPEQQDLQA